MVGRRKRKAKRPKRRNPVAAAARSLRPRVKPSGKVYRRKAKRADPTADPSADDQS